MWGVFWFYILLRIYLSLRIITESGGEGFDKEERSQRGMALLNQTYKSVYTENYPGCLMACIRDSQCMSFNYWRHNSQCDLNNRTRHSAASKFFIKDISSTYMGFMREQGLNGALYRSCRDVPPSNGDGEYSIDPTLSGNPFTVYCDLTTDGGGWTAIQLVTYVESKLQLETTTFYASSYKDISKYNNHRQKVPSSVLLELRNDMGFKQLRFYCYKKTVGVMVHIMTNINPLGEAAVNYFIDDNLISNRPQTCGSYTVLPDDNSTMSEDCSTFGWNGTHGDGKWAKYAAKGRARILRPIMRVKSGYKYIFNSYPTRRDCDDSKDGNASLSVGDTWSIFVR